MEDIVAKLIHEKFSNENTNLLTEDGLSSLALKYSGCSDIILSDEICDEIYSEIGKLINNPQYEHVNGFKIIINNSGNGQLILSASQNSMLFIFNSDELANNVAIVQAATSKRNRANEIFRLDISILFGGNYNGDFNADVAIVQGTCDREFYQNIDNEMAFKNLPPYEYFTVRSKFLIKKDGVVVSIVPNELETKIINFAKSHGLICQRILPFNSVKILFFKNLA